MKTLTANWKPASQHNPWDNGKWEYPNLGGRDILESPIGVDPTRIVGEKHGRVVELGFACDVVFVAGENVYEDREEALFDTFAFGGVIPCGRGDDAAIDAAKAKINARIMARMNQED